MNWKCLLSSLMVFLSACINQSFQLPTTTNTNTVISITHATSTPLPSRTLPTATLKPATQLPLPATTIPPTVLPNPTAVALATFQVSGSICESSFYQTISPNHGWIAFTCQDSPEGETRVRSIDGQLNWVVAFESNERRPEGIVMPVHWSQDGHYLYLATNPVADGWPLYFVDGSALLRLTLQTGKVSRLLQPYADGMPSYAFAFSPDDKSLAYIDNHGWYSLTLHNFDLLSGQSQSIALDSRLAIAGRITWSPIGNHLFLLGSTSQSDFVLALVVLDLINGTQIMRPIPEECDTARSTWLDENIIELRGRDETAVACQFSLRSGQFTKP